MASLVPLATMLRDLSLQSATRRALVARFTARFAEPNGIAVSDGQHVAEKEPAGSR